MLRSLFRLRTPLQQHSRRWFSSDSEEILMLERLLADAQKRQEQQSATSSPQGRTGPKFNVATFNAISPSGLQQFDPDFYNVMDMQSMLEAGLEPHCIMLRSHKLQVNEVPETVRCIARCGAGTNNIPTQDMVERGIPVFNTPGANANAVKEAVICGLFLASRGIYEGIRHTHDVIYPEADSHATAAARIEKDKKLFVGQELTGKTLGVIGLGHIGGQVVEAALSLGMNTIGYDPALSLDAAWRLPGDRMTRATSLEDLLRESDYVSLHVPYMPATHHLLGDKELSLLKPNAHIINFSRGELVKSEALLDKYASGFTGKYISDFADEHMQGHPKMIMLPHLGASTAEAEDNSAAMAASTIQDFLQTGCVINSVNFPTASLGVHESAARLCIVNHNTPGVLGEISSFLGGHSVNIMQQLNMSRDNVAYTVVDMDNYPDEPEDLQAGLGHINGVLSSRFIGNPRERGVIGTPGAGYKVYPENRDT